MQRTLFIRRTLAATLTAAAAIAAHGGPALLTHPAWMATAAALAVVLTLAGTGAGRILRSCSTAPAAPPVWITAGVLLGAQMAAHAALIAMGVHAGMGQAGTLALHAALALVVAILLHGTDAWLEARVRDLARALLDAVAAAPASPTPITVPRPRPYLAASSPRAPPTLA